MAISFEVPEWLRPMSEAEKSRLDENAYVASQRAASMMKRQIGLSRMQDEAQKAVQDGADPVTARQTALLNNAHLLFADNPSQVANIVNSQEANHIRERALFQAAQRQEQKNLIDSLKLDQAQQRLDFLNQQQEDKNTFQSGLLESKKRVLDITEERNAALAKQREAQQESIDLRSQANQKRLERQSDTKNRIEIEKMLQGDTAYADLVNQVTNARSVLNSYQRRKGSKLPLYGTTDSDVAIAAKNLTDAEKALADYREKVGEKFNVDMSSEVRISPSVKPAPETKTAETPSVSIPKSMKEGTVIKQGGKRYRYIGGDTKDPDSYAEIVE